MRTKTINKNKPEANMITVRNVETSTVPVGTPMIFKCAGDTGDGLDVILPSASTAVKATTLFGGVLSKSFDAGEVGDAYVSGFCRNALYTRGTRAATTDAWPSFVAIALGDKLKIDTVANAFVLNGVGAQSDMQAFAAVADSGAVAASTTTAASDAYTQWAGKTSATILMKVILRCM